MASVLAKAKQYGKRIIGYPTEEEDVPVVSVAHWIRGLSQDPKRDVRPLVQLPHLFLIDTHRYPPDPQLCGVHLPDYWMDYSV